MQSGNTAEALKDINNVNEEKIFSSLKKEETSKDVKEEKQEKKESPNVILLGYNSKKETSKDVKDEEKKSSNVEKKEDKK